MPGLHLFCLFSRVTDFGFLNQHRQRKLSVLAFQEFDTQNLKKQNTKICIGGQPFQPNWRVQNLIAGSYLQERVGEVSRAVTDMRSFGDKFWSMTVLWCSGCRYVSRSEEMCNSNEWDSACFNSVSASLTNPPGNFWQ